ncbi:GTP cyclohydrolase I FolE [Nesterenkonia halotolerans]|nr:GTP cyclohydrolase I FolE [Nesterenkonia halotolerans]
MTDVRIEDRAAPALCGEVDLERIEDAIREVLLAVGEDPSREGLRDTPARVARAYQEAFVGMRQDPAELFGSTFEAGHEEMVLVRGISFYSMCEHHLVPFFGVAHIGYLPAVGGNVAGLGALARLVDVFSKRPQVQEQLTTQVVNSLMEHLRPRGAIVVLEAEHLCMSMRGVAKPGAKTITSAVRGQLREAATRAEAMSLISSWR